MSPEELERIYEAVARKIDEVGDGQSELFLAKLVLLLAHRSKDPADVCACIYDAARSLAN